MKDIKKIFGQRVRYYRKNRSMSQEQLAEVCDLHPTYIGQLERGEKNASLETIVRVSAGLGVAPETLFANLSADVSETLPDKIYDSVMLL
ncbi:MAG: helix-turn-helix domain-containing protein, partial [Ruminiclostridium sp.]